MSVNLANFFNSLTTAGLSAVQSLTPTQIGSLVGGVLGASSAEQELGKLLESYQSFYNANNTMGMMMIQSQIATLTGLPQNVTNLIPVVWATAAVAGQGPALAGAVAQVKNAAGV